MAYQQNFNGLGDFGGEMAYDLRQTYAKIVGDHLEDIAAARKKDKYAFYYKSLRDLYIIVHHKFKNNKEERPDGKQSTDDEYFNKLIKDAVTIANQYQNDWIGRTNNSTGCAAIEEVLNRIEMFLYKKIEDAGMFGGNKKVSGL